jgi:hypothetical protein
MDPTTVSTVDAEYLGSSKHVKGQDVGSLSFTIGLRVD